MGSCCREQPQKTAINRPTAAIESLSLVSSALQLHKVRLYLTSQIHYLSFTLFRRYFAYSFFEAGFADDKFHFLAYDHRIAVFVASLPKHLGTKQRSEY